METPASFAVGCDVTIQTKSGQELSGEVFAYDPRLNCVVIKEACGSPRKSTLRFMNTSVISEVASATEPAGASEEALPEVSSSRSAQREARAIRLAELDAAKIGVGVSRRAQQVFDSTSKTLPSRWEGKTIVVLDEVTIEHPYTVESCTALRAKQALDVNQSSTLHRVQLVLASEPQLALDGVEGNGA